MSDFPFNNLHCKGDETAKPTIQTKQRAKKVVSDSPGLVDFAIGLVNSVLNLSDGQAKIPLCFSALY